MVRRCLQVLKSPKCLLSLEDPGAVTFQSCCLLTFHKMPKPIAAAKLATDSAQARLPDRQQVHIDLYLYICV